MTFVEHYAKWLARTSHGYIRQKRKYTGERYAVHVEEVHDIVMAHGGTKYQGAAAFGHDEIENVVTKLQSENRWIALKIFWFLFNLQPAQVKKLVYELTDEFTSENYPNQNRAWRKTQEAHRISQISDESKTIKLADLFSNTASIIKDDPKFAITYLKEKHHMMKGLHGHHVNRDLYHLVENQLKQNIDKLKVIV